MSSCLWHTDTVAAAAGSGIRGSPGERLWDRRVGPGRDIEQSDHTQLPTRQARFEVFTNVMWATDGSAHADRALGYATQIALQEGATLHAVHVVEKFATGRVAGQNAYLNEDEIAAKIQREVGDESEDIASVLHVIIGKTGDAAALIAERAREVKADLIVVGTRGHSPLSGAILGSVTQRLLHLAPCPVLAVPPVAVSPAEPEGSELISDAH